MENRQHLVEGEIKNAVILGASGDIGFSLVKQLLERNSNINIWATYRKEQSAQKLEALVTTNKEKLELIRLNAEEESHFEDLCRRIALKTKQIDLVMNCLGFLHSDQDKPEKRLSDINLDALVKSYLSNGTPVVLLAKHLFSFLKNKNPAIFASLSARVGSISDNRSGGWYAYRATKSAHNMFLKNISLELDRFRCNTLCLSLHPGTTKTKLSEPFINNTPYKLHSSDETAANLLKVMFDKTMEDNGGFFDWQGKSIEW